MDKRFIIIHPSEIIRKGLWAILREAFHYEFILLKALNEVSNYSGFSKTELYVFLEESYCNASSKAFITRILNNTNLIHFISINEHVETNADLAIYINEGSFDIVQKIKLIDERSEVRTNTMSDLSEREKDVLVQVALGHTNKEIADKLFISIHTVISHRKHITDKLGIKSISGLTVYAILNKLIDTKNIDPSTLI